MSIEESIENYVLGSKKLSNLIDQKVEQRIAEMKIGQCYTRKQLKDLWQVSYQLIDSMTKEELSQHGLKKIRLASCIRFESIKTIRPSREDYLRTRKI